MHNGLKFIVFLFFSVIQIPYSFSQVEKSNLLPLLSSSDQKKNDKIETTLKKAESIKKESEDIKNSATNEKEIYKNEKKYSLKRLEAAQHYQKANNDMINLLRDNIQAFWKKNKPDQVKQAIKNNEDKAGELFRKARSLRYVAEDLIYPEEKLEKIIEAEEVEKDAIAIYIKVLYAYLNKPVEYNVIANTDRTEIDITQPPDKKSVEIKSKSQSESGAIEYIPASGNNVDSVQNLTLPSENSQKQLITKENTPKEQALNTELTNRTKDSTSIYNLVDVKEEHIDKFNKYLKDTFPDSYEHYVIDFKSLNYHDIESLKESWRRYLYNPQYAYEPESTNNKTNIQDTSVIISENKPIKNTVAAIHNQKPEQIETNAKENLQLSAKNKSLKNPENKDNTTSEASQTLVQSTAEKTTRKAQNKTKSETNTSPVNKKVESLVSSDTRMAEGFIYRVQVLACRIPIDSQSLKHIYNGDLKILELNEDKWFKYAIGEFNTYSEARELKNKVKVPGAFIIAYLNGKRIKILNTENYSPNNSYSPTGLITYKVQISASKKALDEKYLRNIYAGNHKIEETFEDDCYKYSIVFGSSLNKALNFIQNENIPGAFIISYKNNKKIELREALRVSKTN